MKRIVVFAEGCVGRSALRALRRTGDEICSVVFRPTPTCPSPEAVRKMLPEGCRCLLSEDISKKETIIDLVRETTPDIVYAFDYANVLPQEVVDAPPLGAYGIHTSLLPAYRGRSSVQWAIMNGERVTGVTLYKLTGHIDGGDVVGQISIPVDARESVFSLYGKMASRTYDLVGTMHGLVAEGSPPLKSQDESQASYFPPLSEEDARIDWNESAARIDALCRAFSRPFGGAYCYHDSLKLIIWECVPEGGSLPRPPGVVMGINPLLIGTAAGVVRVMDAEAVDTTSSKRMPVVHKGRMMSFILERGDRLK